MDMVCGEGQQCEHDEGQQCEHDEGQQCGHGVW